MNFKTFRLRRGLTIEQLAEKSGCSKNTISGIEHGRTPHHTTIEKISRALGVEKKELLQLIFKGE